MSGSNSMTDNIDKPCDNLKTIEDHSGLKIDEGSKQNVVQEGLTCIYIILQKLKINWNELKLIY